MTGQYRYRRCSYIRGKRFLLRLLTGTLLLIATDSAFAGGCSSISGLKNSPNSSGNCPDVRPTQSPTLVPGSGRSGGSGSLGGIPPSLIGAGTAAAAALFGALPREQERSAPPASQEGGVECESVHRDSLRYQGKLLAGIFDNSCSATRERHETKKQKWHIDRTLIAACGYTLTRGDDTVINSSNYSAIRDDELRKSALDVQENCNKSRALWERCEQYLREKQFSSARGCFKNLRPIASEENNATAVTRVDIVIPALDKIEEQLAQAARDEDARRAARASAATAQRHFAANNPYGSAGAHNPFGTDKSGGEGGSTSASSSNRAAGDANPYSAGANPFGKKPEVNASVGSNSDADGQQRRATWDAGLKYLTSEAAKASNQGEAAIWQQKIESFKALEPR
jgi:hypothetical protein